MSELQIISQYFGIPEAAITGRSRLRKVADVRFYAYKFIRETTKLTLTEIGIIFNGRDHSTIINGIQQVDNIKFLTDQYNNFKKHIQNA